MKASFLKPRAFSWNRAAVAGVALAAAVAAGLVHTQPVAGQPGAQTLGPPSCTSANCHAKEAGWWRVDPHYRTADVYLEGDPEFNKIARAYGINPDNPAEVNKLCFNCHGTVVSGAENDEVEYGVSCESCHGPGSGYKDPHQKSYEQGVATGMAALKDLNKRAALCIDCHVVTDQKLLRVHRPGWTSSSKYTRGMKGISVHWKQFVEEDKDPAPFDKILAKVVAVLPDIPPPTGVPGGTGAATQSPAARPVVQTVIKEVMAPGPWLVLGPDRLKPVSLPPSVAPPDSAATVDLLRTLRQRLQTLYAALDAAYKAP